VQVAEGALTNIPTDLITAYLCRGCSTWRNRPLSRGPKVAGRRNGPQKDPRRDAFWYRRTFKLAEPIPSAGDDQVGKAMFGTRVILNGKLLGSCAMLHSGVLRRTGGAYRPARRIAHPCLGRTAMRLARRYTSGSTTKRNATSPASSIVELILSGVPNIENVQIAPDLSSRQARVRVWLKHTADGDVTSEVREAKSRKLAAKPRRA